MVKHQKEKLYQSALEHRAISQERSGRQSAAGGAIKTNVRRLPFNCCALTLTPYTTPVCTPSGVIFENSAILPHLMKHKVDPVTGERMTSRDLITLHMDKDDETGKWQCPVLSKPFTDHSKVVAVIQRPPGNEANVFSYEAVQELNYKCRNYEDLISGKKFKKEKDVISLLDPFDEKLNELRDIDNFKHMADIRRDVAAELDDSAGAVGAMSGKIRHSVTAQRIMSKLAENAKKAKKEEEVEKEKKRAVRNLCESSEKKPRRDRQLLSTGSLTSTTVSSVGDNERRELTQEEIMEARWKAMKRLKKKGYCKIVTNLGSMNVELHCDIVPRTTVNFIGLANQGKYEGSKFHRNIRNFMIQGGKPASGKGGEGCSLWGDEAFPDEFDNRLSHDGKGVLSMANSGPDTNRSQFFITYKSCAYLDKKHTVFGRVVGGLDVLKTMENAPTDKKDRPKQDIIIMNVDVVVDPTQEAEETERRRVEQEAEERLLARQERRSQALGKTMAPSFSSKKNNKQRGGKREGGGNDPSTTTTIGRYLPKGTVKNLQAEEYLSLSSSHKGRDRGLGSDDGKEAKSLKRTSSSSSSRTPPPPKKTIFRDFSGW